MPCSASIFQPKRVAALAGAAAGLIALSALSACDTRGTGDGTGTADPATRDRDAATDRDNVNQRDDTRTRDPAQDRGVAPDRDNVDQRGDERRTPQPDRSGGMRADDADEPDAGRPVQNPNEQTSSMPNASPPQADAGPVSELDDSSSIWTVPSNWRERSDNPPMRHATLIVPDQDGEIEVAISRFPGDVGGELANINRWRGQMGLDALEEDELEEHVDRFEHPGFEGFVLRIEGEDEHMLTASIYEENADRTWYVRASASPDAAERIEESVFAFARSFGQGR